MICNHFVFLIIRRGAIWKSLYTTFERYLIRLWLLADNHGQSQLTKGDIMEFIRHPISGENGYFCSEREKVLIDAIIRDYSSQFVLNAPLDEECE